MSEMTEAQKLEFEIYQMSQRLAELRRAEPDNPVPDYAFETLSGPVPFSALFADKDRLLVIHNMGQGCRYCTLWADGINGVLDHLEDSMSVVLVSKDTPETQRRFGQSRGWRMRMASHGGGAYMADHCTMGEEANAPGCAIYQRKDGQVVKRGTSMFGPGDLYAPVWHFLALAGISADQWVPQYRYWTRPGTLDDGGSKLLD